METVEGRAAENHMVCTFERDHLKGYGLFSVVFFTDEGNLEGDGPEELSLVARNHSIKSDSTGTSDHRTYWQTFGTVALRERIAAPYALAVGGPRNV
jgi:hypothetical protein